MKFQYEFLVVTFNETLLLFPPLLLVTFPSNLPLIWSEEKIYKSKSALWKCFPGSEAAFSKYFRGLNT
jgi:hypothetical protein